MKRFDREYLELLTEVTLAEWKRGNRRSFLGILWSVLNPLLMVAVLFAVFRVRFVGDVDSYPLYLLIGMVLYTHFANATSASVTVLRSMKSLTVGTTIPKEVLVLGTVLSRTLDLVLTLAFCVAVAALSGQALGAAVWMALPAVLLLQLTLALWVSLLLAVSYVYVRDVQPIYQVFLRILFVITPIFYPRELLGAGTAQRLIDWNPLATLLEMARGTLLEGRAPSVVAMLVFLVVNATLLVVSLGAFGHLEPGFAERV